MFNIELTQYWRIKSVKNKVNSTQPSELGMKVMYFIRFNKFFIPKINFYLIIR